MYLLVQETLVSIKIQKEGLVRLKTEGMKKAKIIIKKKNQNDIKDPEGDTTIFPYHSYPHTTKYGH